jgi:DNA-binding NarL/FixJ family response regulator
MKMKPLLLLIEDDSVDTGLAVIRLMENFTITTASTIHEALPLLKSMKFDAVVLDISLPDINRSECVKTVKQYSGDAPLLVLSGSRDPKLIEQCIMDSACQFLVKGIHDAPPGALVHAVNAGISTHQTVRRLDQAQQKIETSF